MPAHDQSAARFRYDGYSINPSSGEVSCTYSTGGHSFTERYDFDPAGDWSNPAAEAAVRILFLLAGVSYYKTTAAPLIDLGSTSTSADERAFLTRFYAGGLAEFAYRNHLDLSGLSVVGPESEAAPALAYAPSAGRPLVPFGGGIDSIVTVAGLQAEGADATLFVVSPPGDRFAAIEDVAAVTGLPVVHVSREIDPLVRRSAELGFLNGHVPITAVITASALVAAVLGGHDAVVLSNEWSASKPTLMHEGRPVNHQWSKSAAFEEDFGRLVTRTLGEGVAVFSYLRPRSELWVAQQFAALRQFHGVFRSCNRAFTQDPAQRLDHWCGVCDKCCFIDLILAPFMDAAELRAVFDGREPLENPALAPRFGTLLGLAPETKPFECVGDVGECRAAILLAAARPDRAQTELLQTLREDVSGTPTTSPSAPAELLVPIGPHAIPDRYAPPDLLVRAH
jgi:hypothetical protein